MLLPPIRSSFKEKLRVAVGGVKAEAEEEDEVK